MTPDDMKNFLDANADDIKAAVKAKMIEDQIERRVEMIMDSLDARLMSGSLSWSDYNKEVQRLREWAERHVRRDARCSQQPSEIEQ